MPALAAVGRTLNVRYLVEGSVRRGGDRVRVSVRLIDARTGFRAWGDDYDRGTRDLLALQEGIAREVAVQIAGRLLPAERAALSTRTTQQPEAYDHFLRGNYYLRQRTPRAVARAIEEFQTAGRLDTTYVSAFARAAYGYAVFAEWGWPYPGVTTEALLARGLAAADRALARDSGSADGWMARAYILLQLYPRTLEGVREAFEHAIALAPRNAEAWHQYGWALNLLGEDSAAVAAYHEALKIEPDRGISLMALAGVHAYGRRFDEAARWLDSTLVVEPSVAFYFALRGWVRLWTGEVAGAEADARAAISVGGEDRVYGNALLAAVETRHGDSAIMRATLDSLVTVRSDPRFARIIADARPPTRTP